MIDYSVYLVTDEPSRYEGNWLDAVCEAVEGGVTCVQYRDTENPRDVQFARIHALRDALKAFKTPIVVNNDAELARAVRAEGVHVGQHDMPPAQVRAIVGKGCEIGLSLTCAREVDEFLSGPQRPFVDALGIGPVFDARKTKADAASALGVEGFRTLCDRLVAAGCELPRIAIGGITIAKVSDVLAAGACGLAVVSAFSRAERPGEVAKEMRGRCARPCCLTIAGSDSGGNAGVQADLRTFHCYGLHGCTVFAALTAQNPFGVSAIHAVPPDFVAAQLESVLGVYNIRALKTGMLADARVIEVVADRIAAHPEIARVIDPVMVATSGAKLISDAAIEALKTHLLPKATLMTPNFPEAEVLAGHPFVSPDARAGSSAHAAALACELANRFGCAVLVKGGHGVNAAAVDVLYDGREMREFPLPWIQNPISTHGTGCSLAAALAAELAQGRDLVPAVEGAKRYVHSAIERSYLVGNRCGVLGFPF